ncbi:tRNA (cytosine(32)/uridine(32)-2'-O)-methyltransferase TrmJ [Rheinheimera sp.]|uniref:tRNA (cytosine(32)/uridine(32)-2'-O)-methyltransferase TrmJ n=1 Tax=Rheinheimera sp. TaxID=1869214 RepID=UPI00307EB18B
MLEQIRIVLVETSHTGNIGSVARAMKTMGLSQLVLVSPKELPDGQAYALSAGASDVLANARVVDSLAQAIADCRLVIGTSHKPKSQDHQVLNPRQAAELTVPELTNGPVAIVFGRESNGLSNDELRLCHYHLCIPTSAEYTSLNLAMAVQVVSYEMRMALLAQQPAQDQASEEKTSYPTSEQLEGFYQHLQTTLDQTGFIIRAHPGHIMIKLRRLFTRARPDEIELNILRGILTSVQRFGGVNKSVATPEQQ